LPDHPYLDLKIYTAYGFSQEKSELFIENHENTKIYTLNTIIKFIRES